MRRLAAVVVALSLIGAACNQGSNRETVLPDIPEELPPTDTTLAPAEPVCMLGFGTGKGAEILEVVAGVPAESVLAAGDVVVEVEGRAITDSTELIAAIQSKAIGDTISVGVDRSGEEFTGEVELIEHSDTPGTPMAGISIRTAVDLVAPGDLTTVTTARLDDPATRITELDGRLFALDPVQGAWEPIADEIPESPWAAVAGAIYTLEDTDPDVLVDVAGDARLDLIPETWNTRWVLGSIGSNVLMVAERDVGESLETAMLAIDPATGDVAWEYLPGASDADLPLVPVLGIPDPTQSRILVALAELTTTDTDLGALRFVIVDASGAAVGMTPPLDGAIPADSLAIGWHDGDRVAYLPPDRERVILWDVDSGAVADVVIPRLASATELVPVGDGERFIMETATGLDLVATDTVRPLAVDCVADRISALGYGV